MNTWLAHSCDCVYVHMNIYDMMTYSELHLECKVKSRSQSYKIISFQTVNNYKMDCYGKWEMHNNCCYMPFHTENAGTSHYQFGAPYDLGFKHGFDGHLPQQIIMQYQKIYFI